MNLTRQQLYDEVWAEPVTKIAKRLGLSDRGLGKLCARHDIPVPPRGYWARKAHGYTDPIEPLSTKTRPADEPIFIAERKDRRQGAVDVVVPPAVRTEQQAENRIAIHEGPPRHPLVRLTSTALRAVRPDDYGRVRPGRGALDLSVSKASSARALRILDALILALEARAHMVSIKDLKSVATVNQEPIEFGLDERAIQKSRTLTDKEQLELNRGGYVYGRYTYVPSGELTLSLKNVWGTRHKWSDRKKAAIEQQLNDIVEGFVIAADYAKVRRLEREREEKRWREAERSRQEEAERARNLEEWTKQWERCQRYRSFLDAMQKSFEHDEMPPKLAAYFAWARKYVDQLDPLRVPSADFQEESIG